jgi:hypothetical protein
MGVDYKISSSKGKITVVHHDRLKRGYASVNGGNVVCPAPELGGDRVVYTAPTDAVQPNCGNAPHIPRFRHGNLKLFIRLIGTALLRSNTLRGNTVVIAILVGKNIIVEGWCIMIL